MAKISARGDVEVARWRHPETGAEYVLTKSGRILVKRFKGDTLRRAQGSKLAAAEREQFVAALVHHHGYERVK